MGFCRQSTTDRNISLIYLFRAFMAADSLLLPMLLPFYQSLNISFSQVAILQSVFAMTIVVFQLPTGWFADLFGRRKTLLIGAVFCFTARMLYLSGASFEAFLVAEVCLGLGFAFISGADYSLLYDSLASQGQQENFPKAVARSRVGELLVCGICSVLSGYIATNFSIHTVFSFGGLGFLMMVIVAYNLHEPKRERAPSDLKQMTTLCFAQIRSNPVIPWCITFFAIIFAINQPLVYLWEPFLRSTGVTLSETGWFFSGMFFWGALMGWVTPRLIKKMGEFKVLCLLLCVDVFSFIGVSLLVTPYVALFFLGHQSVRSSLIIVTQSMLNKHLDSKVRTTMISLLSMSGYILYSIVFIPLGQFKVNHSFQQAFMVLGVLSLLAALWAIKSRSIVFQRNNL